MPTNKNSKNSDEVISALAAIGMDPESIAGAVNRPIKEIRGTIIQSRRTEADEVLRDEARAFARLAMRRARLFLEFGLPSQQMAIIRSVLPPAMRSLGAVNEGSNDDTKAELQVLFSEIRNVPGATKTIGAAIDVESTPAPEATEDQDQIFGDEGV